MATSQKGESSGTIGSMSKFAGTLVGTVVVTGKRIIGSAATKPKKKAVKRKPAGSSGKGGTPKKKQAQSPAKKKKKKVAKRKPAGSSGKGGASKKKQAQSPAKKKKSATPKKKKTARKKKKKAKSKASSHSQSRLISQVGAETNVPIETQEPQLLIAEAEMADEKFSSASVSPEVDTGKNGTTGTQKPRTGTQKPPVRIIEYSDKPDKATVPTTSDI